MDDHRDDKDLRRRRRRNKTKTTKNYDQDDEESNLDLYDTKDPLLRNFFRDLELVSKNISEIHKCFDQMIGVQLPQVNIILVVDLLDEGEGVSVGKVSKRLKVKSTYIASQANSLEAQGLLQRVQFNQDRCSVLLSLTAKGKKTHAKILTKQKEISSMVSGAGIEKDFRLLVDCISKIEVSRRPAADPP